jgi:hypothetical protein
MILDNLLQVAAADPQLCRDLVHGVENGNHVCLSLTHATSGRTNHPEHELGSLSARFKLPRLDQMTYLPLRYTNTRGKLFRRFQPLVCLYGLRIGRGETLLLFHFPKLAPTRFKSGDYQIFLGFAAAIPGVRVEEHKSC